ncbi:ribbon-helix-helix domain-containing protein [Rhizobium sp. LjRoot254]|uniref:ribbon-helix-helix domain-containing protein n=1 Tax=Rhizobium sp. LjRoot254 TaxID=3342297 RepID=UPI003ED06A13
MSALKEMQISLPADLAARLKHKVETGRYSSESDVIAESLSALEEREAEIESWLVNDVGPAYDRWMADPSRAVSIDEAFARLQARIDSSKDRA